VLFNLSAFMRSVGAKAVEAVKFSHAIIFVSRATDQVSVYLREPCLIPCNASSAGQGDRIAAPFALQLFAVAQDRAHGLVCRQSKACPRDLVQVGTRAHANPLASGMGFGTLSSHRNNQNGQSRSTAVNECQENPALVEAASRDVDMIFSACCQLKAR